jgi:hypothetical protein
MSEDNCTCGLKFRSGEDYRDHLPCPGTEEHQLTEKWRKRCGLAEKALVLMVDSAAVTSDFLSDFLNESDTHGEALLAWEKARGQRFIYTDGQDHVIASGRAGLNTWLVEQDFDSEQTDWELVPMETPIAIACDAEGAPCHRDDDEYAGTPVTRTAEEWLKKVKEDGLLCSEDL